MAKNVLKMSELIKLVDWLRKDTARLDGLSDPALAALATKELGFEVVAANVREACPAAGIERVKARSAKAEIEPGVKRSDFQLLVKEIIRIRKRQNVNDPAGDLLFNELVVEYGAETSAP